MLLLSLKILTNSTVCWFCFEFFHSDFGPACCVASCGSSTVVADPQVMYQLHSQRSYLLVCFESNPFLRSGFTFGFSSLLLRLSYEACFGADAV